MAATLTLTSKIAFQVKLCLCRHSNWQLESIFSLELGKSSAYCDYLKINVCLKEPLLVALCNSVSGLRKVALRLLIVDVVKPTKVLGTPGCPVEIAT